MTRPLWLVCGLLPATLLAQPVLRHDLFAPPKLPPAVPAKAANVGSEASGQVSAPPVLSSVLSAGAKSMAVLDGVVLPLNGAHRGYRLLQVGDRHVVLLFQASAWWSICRVNTACPSRR
jgi:hypothetical protein